VSNEIAVFTKDLALHERQFKSVLPAHIPSQKFMRTIVGAVQNNPSILKCNRSSIYAACQKAAQDGLILDGREAAIVQFKGSAQYMPMVAGLLKKLRNSGQISTITAQTVHEKDKFAYNPANDDVPDHQPDWFGERGPMIGVYAVAKMKDGGSVVELMNMEQIAKVRGVSRASGRGPWSEWPEEMAKKSVLRRIAKYLPSSADLDQMLEHDNENYTYATDVQETDKPSQDKTTTRSAAIIEAEVFEEEPPMPEGPEDYGEVAVEEAELL
jgi:recombination protein RecT